MVAHDPARLEVITKALEGHELVLVNDLQAAQYQILEDEIDLFVVGIHFDDSRSIELIDLIQKDQKHTNTPVILIRLLHTPLADFLRTTVATLIKLGTVTQYLELADDLNPELSLREAVSSCLIRN